MENKTKINKMLKNKFKRIESGGSTCQVYSNGDVLISWNRESCFAGGRSSWRYTYFIEVQRELTGQEKQLTNKRFELIESYTGLSKEQRDKKVLELKTKFGEGR